MEIRISNTPLLFRSHATYTPKEILAAGGTTAFGRKSGKNNSALLHTLANTAPIEPFTDEEWNKRFNNLKKQ